MDAFEELVSEILWTEGYWVQTSVKVSLTKEEKREIGKPSAPRWELDVVAYRARENILRVIECKSYLDSKGVQSKDIISPTENSRDKLFVDPVLRRVVLNRLKLQLLDSGACNQETSVRLGLACGKIASEKDRQELQTRFKSEDWELLEEEWLRSKLKHVALGGYENQVSAIVAKLLLRPHSK